MKNNILIVENDKRNVDSIKSILGREGVTIYTSDTRPGPGLVGAVIENEIDVILLSLDKPGADGCGLIEELQNTERTKDVPVIVIIDGSAFSCIKETLDAGAYDYIKMPPDPVELVVRVHAALRYKTKIDMLRDTAERDALTRLFNKWYFNRVIEEHVQKLRCYPDGLALVMLDCDHFKKINDNYGHMAGDVVLSSVANAMSKSVKQNDVVCRFGGEEFCIILPDTTKSQAYEITERIRRNISKIIFNFKDETVKITISSGISHSDSSDKKTASRLINESDIALYSAKNNGRDRTEVFWNENEYSVNSERTAVSEG